MLDTPHTETKPTDERFAFSRENYTFLLAGIAIVILGYLLMMGGGSESPTEFDEAIFSARRITVAPIVVLIGYGVMFYAIMKRKRA